MICSLLGLEDATGEVVVVELPEQIRRLILMLAHDLFGLKRFERLRYCSLRDCSLHDCSRVQRRHNRGSEPPSRERRRLPSLLPIDQSQEQGKHGPGVEPRSSGPGIDAAFDEARLQPFQRTHALVCSDAKLPQGGKPDQHNL